MNVAFAVFVRDFTDFFDLGRAKLPSDYLKAHSEAILLYLAHKPAFFEGGVVNIGHGRPP
jgi:hypothetical protein